MRNNCLKIFWCCHINYCTDSEGQEAHVGVCTVLYEGESIWAHCIIWWGAYMGALYYFVKCRFYEKIAQFNPTCATIKLINL